MSESNIERKLQASVDSEEFAGQAPSDDHPLSWKDKLLLFLNVHWRGVITALTPLIMLPILFPTPTEQYQWCAYTLMLMAIYWMTECIPLAITSFLPVLIFPLTGVMNSSLTCQCYMNDTIIMFLGSIILAYAIEQCGLHKRLALCVIRLIGYSHYRLLLAMSFTTMFISMWITNTAATTMMVPIIFAVLKVFEDQNLLTVYETDSSGNKVASDVTTCYFCAASFSATIGGIGTIVGTATNLVFKGLFQRTYPDAPEYLSFPKFSFFSIPYMLLMEVAMYFYMLIVYFGFLRPKSEAAKKSIIPEESMNAAKHTVDEDWKKLGKITFWEVMVIILFGLAMMLFFSRSPQIFTGWGDKIVQHFEYADKRFVLDSAVAAFVAFLMMLLPANLDFFKNFTAKDVEQLPKGRIRAVLDWKLMTAVMPFSFSFLLGGGFALSEAAKKENSDLNGKIGEMLRVLENMHNYFIIFMIIVFTVVFTNLASNVAVCNVIVPIVMTLALEVKINPLWYNIASGFSASYCFLLPVGTPGNLIIQGVANIPTGKMIKAGLGPTVTTILLTWIAMCFWAPIVWPELRIQPSWMYN